MIRSWGQHRRRLVLTGSIVVAMAVLSGIGWSRSTFTSSMEMMLPQRSEAREAIEFLRDSKFAAKAILWFKLAPGAPEEALFAAADRTVTQLDSALIQRVIRPPRQAKTMDMLTNLLDYQSDLVDAEQLGKLDAAMQPDAVRKQVRDIYVQMLKPTSSFMEKMVRHDPLGISQDLLTRLYGLTKVLGYRAELRRGHFVHSDGRQLILVLETTAPLTDITGSRQLVSHLTDLASHAGPDVTITPIAGHIHTVQNDRIMREDIQRVVVLDLIGFTLVFLLICRDWRIAAIFVLPIAAITVSIGMCGLVFTALATMVMGLAATMAGSAVDYGIHVYTAVRLGSDPFADARRIARPLFTGMLATLGVFVAFMFSAVPAYQQLGAMASIALLLSALAALYILPAVVRQGGHLLRIQGMPMRHWSQRVRPIAGVMLLLCVVGAVVASYARFDPDLTKLDGTSEQVLEAERQFQHTWSRDEFDLAMVAVTAPTLEQASMLNDRVYQTFAQQLSDANFVSLASFWPSAQRRAANRQAWLEFWSEQRIGVLRNRLADAGEPYGFASDAFDPFFENLREPAPQVEGVGPMAFIQEQFVVKAEDHWIILNYFQDSPEHVATARAMARQMPDVQVISRRALGQAMANALITESRRIVLFSAVFIILSMLAMTRHLRRSLVMMLPAFVGVSAMLSLHVLGDLPLNAASVIAGIVVFGLCIDYGVFTVHAWRRDETTVGHGMTSVHLSSVTTLVGAGALLWANHPALFLVGVTLTTGLAAGYAAAVVLVPVACAMLLRDDMVQSQEATQT